MDIQPGMQIEVTTARGERLPMIARSDVTFGRDVRIVWVSELDAYADEGEGAHQIPWPVDAVHVPEKV